MGMRELLEHEAGLAHSAEREPTSGLEYLRTEPLKAYEEQKAEREKKEKAEKEKTEKDKVKKGAEQKPEAMAAAVEPPGAGQTATGQAPEEELGEEGMMAGVVGPGKGKPEEKKKPLPVTTWGRYAKVLLSSSEFLFVN